MPDSHVISQNVQVVSFLTKLVARLKLCSVFLFSLKKKSARLFLRLFSRLERYPSICNSSTR